MAKIKLNIRDAKNKSKVAKTLEVEGYDLMMGTVDDFMEIIDLDKIGDQKEVLLMIAKSYKQLKPLLMDIFPDLTDEDYRLISINDLADTIPQVGVAIIDNVKMSKN